MTSPASNASAPHHGPASTGAPHAGRLAAMLEGPILPTLLKLALPTILVLIVQTFVNVAEAYFVSHLGTDALAGTALVFPVFMLMATMSNGGIGGGIASATARALGAGSRRDAESILLHGIVLGILFGLAFTLGVALFGVPLYRALGGEGAALQAALEYSGVLFGASVLIWVVNLIASSLRGAGEVRVPAQIILLGAVIVVPASPALIYGFGPISGFGIQGAAIAIVIYYLVALGILVAYLRGKRTPLRLGWHRLEARLMKDILSVGGISAIGTVQTNLTVAFVTGLVGIYGTAALAGYGIGSRLDYLLIPLLFGLGSAAVTMVGANIGAGKVARARRVAWISALIAGGATEIIGLLAAFFPAAWIGLFTDDAEVLAIGSEYLRLVGPTYGFFGMGLLIYFSSQGAKRVGMPVLGGTIRMAVAGGGGWLVLHVFGGDRVALFATAAAASVAYGLMVALMLRYSRWRRTA